MELKDLRLLFDGGALTKATITKDIMGNGYIVTVDAKGGNQHIISGQRTKGEPRVFKSIDAAVKNVSDIGFKHVLVSL